MSSEDVNAALERAADNSPTGNLRGTQAIADRYFLAQEVKRLRAESVHAPVAMYGKPGREPICDFDCDYCREGDEPEGIDDENLRTWKEETDV